MFSVGVGETEAAGLERREHWLGFREGKSACRTAEYQARRWPAWHHHMALVMIAKTFLAKERIAHRETAELLSGRDLVDNQEYRSG